MFNWIRSLLKPREEIPKEVVDIALHLLGHPNLVFEGTFYVQWKGGMLEFDEFHVLFESHKIFTQQETDYLLDIVKRIRKNKREELAHAEQNRAKSLREKLRC